MLPSFHFRRRRRHPPSSTLCSVTVTVCCTPLILFWHSFWLLRQVVVCLPDAGGLFPQIKTSGIDTVHWTWHHLAEDFRSERLRKTSETGALGQCYDLLTLSRSCWMLECLHSNSVRESRTPIVRPFLVQCLPISKRSYTLTHSLTLIPVMILRNDSSVENGVTLSSFSATVPRSISSLFNRDADNSLCCSLVT